MEAFTGRLSSVRCQELSPSCSPRQVLDVRLPDPVGRQERAPLPKQGSLNLLSFPLRETLGHPDLSVYMTSLFL